MKKFILLFMISLLALNVFATDEQKETKGNETKEEYVTDTDAEKLVDKYSKEFSAAIESLAESLEKPASHVYNVLITQKTVEAYSYLTLIFILVITTTILYLILRKFEKKETSITNNNIIGTTVAFMLIAIIVAGIVTGVTIDNIIMGLFNPEYGAIKDIFELVKGG